VFLYRYICMYRDDNNIVLYKHVVLHHKLFNVRQKTGTEDYIFFVVLNAIFCFSNNLLLLF